MEFDFIKVFFSVPYYIFLFMVSLGIFVLERLWPWHKRQKAFRKEFGQDILWLIFNGHFLGLGLAYLTVFSMHFFNQVLFYLQLPSPESFVLFGSMGLPFQMIFFVVIKDFLEWMIHRMLHRYSFLWQFHKLHHSIEQLDWIGNMRFHWMEIVIYKSCTYLPLAFLGIHWKVLLMSAVVSTLIGHLNHSNLRITWGPFKYILNSPAMHIWHHDVEIHPTKGDGKSGQNYAILFSTWDWIFQTAYWPSDKKEPDKIGFKGIEQFPRSAIGRFIYPFIK